MPDNTLPIPQPSPKSAAAARADGLADANTDQAFGAVKQISNKGKTTCPNPIYSSQMFSHFHPRANFIGTMAQVIKVPERIVSPNPMVTVNPMAFASGAVR